MFRNRRRLIRLVIIAAASLLGSLSLVSPVWAAWLIEGGELAGSAALASTAGVMEGFKLVANGTTVECTAANLENVMPQITAPDSIAAGALTFAGCSTTGGNCALVGTSVRSLPVVGLVTTVGAAEDLAVIKPKTKTLFATIEVAGVNCTIAHEVLSVVGTILVTAPTGQAEATLQEVGVNTPSGELKIGGFPATIKGKVLYKLEPARRYRFG